MIICSQLVVRETAWRETVLLIYRRMKNITNVPTGLPGSVVTVFMYHFNCKHSNQQYLYWPHKERMIPAEYAVHRFLSSSSMNPTPGLHTFGRFITVGQTSLNLPWAIKAPSTEFLNISGIGLINNTSMLISPNAYNETTSQLTVPQQNQIASVLGIAA